MSSPINKKELEHLASLARIELEDKEEDKLLKDLEMILAYFEELRLLDTSIVFPMSGGSDIKNVSREDESRKNTNKGIGTESFPDEENGYLKIPKVF